MAIIKIKTGNSSSSILSNGELGFDTDKKVLYIGDNNTNYPLTEYYECEYKGTVYNSRDCGGVMKTMANTDWCTIPAILSYPGEYGFIQLTKGNNYGEIYCLYEKSGDVKASVIEGPWSGPGIYFFYVTQMPTGAGSANWGKMDMIKVG